MDRLRLSDLRASVALVLNVCTTDASVASYINRAERRLVARGKWLNTVTRYRICTTATGCLTWPRQIETIEAYWICSTPGDIKNGWYEASLTGPGLLNSEDSWFNTLIDRGTLPTFDTIEGTASKVAVRADVGEAVGSRILLRGYNQLGEWIRTQDAGVWIDGEYVTISTVTQYTTNFFSSITGVIKPTTNGPVRMWQFNPTTGQIVKQLAYYEPDEQVPIYRASLLPGLANRSGCSTDQGCQACTGTSNQVTVIAKLRHIDVVSDNDFLLLGNEGAITLAVQAILKEERNLLPEAQAYWAMAISELQAELSSYQGDGAIPTIKMESSQSWGPGVLNAVQMGYPLNY